MTHATTNPYTQVGQRLNAYQQTLVQRGTTLKGDIEDRYLTKWRSESLFHVARIRTALVSGMQDFLIREGLLNLERVSMSLVTDPLAHGVERLAAIPYRQSPYVATHSMIYSKFMACQNPFLKGIFVDSPNIRLELPDPGGAQRGRYLVDFSQLDVECRRSSSVDLETYLHCPDEVSLLLRKDLDQALSRFEGMARAGLGRVTELCGESLEALGVTLDLPRKPFPVFHLDDALARFPKEEVEARLGEETDSPCFWVVGLMRENYDLIYPYLRPDGTRRPIDSFSSREVFNYDLCVKGTRKDGLPAPAKEVLSGGLREWLPEGRAQSALFQEIRGAENQFVRLEIGPRK